jgi:MFS family permease
MKLLSGYIKLLKSTRREVRIFLFATVLYWLGMTLVQLYLNFYLQALQVSPGWIGAINAAPQMTIVVMTFVIGGLSRRIGSWRAMLIGTTIAGSALLLTAASSEAWQVFATSMLMGLGGGFVWSNAGPFLMQHSEESARSTLFSLQAALGTLSGFVAFLGGGALPGLYAGLTGQAQDSATVMRWILVTTSTAYFTSLIPLFLAKPDNARNIKAHPARAEQPSPASGKRRFLPSNRGLVVKLLAPGALVALGAGMTIPFMNLYVEQKFDVNFAELGQLFAWTSIATAVALLLQPVLADRVGQVKSVVMVQVASLPFLIVLGFVPIFPLVAIALFVRAALMNMGNPVFSAYSLGRLEPADRPTFTSLSSSTWSLGWALGSWISGLVRGVLGFEAGFYLLFGLMAGLYATSTVIMWFLFGREEQQKRAQEPKHRLDEEGALAA